ncbi:MAG TPA: helix-turn-helix domain-containing protein, partial [Ferruginibacter sp.]|nr:helix-turn-helix domain-containing protein [Ferruginibacter sp.]
TKMITERLRYKFYFIKEIAYHDPENSVSKLIDYIRKTKKHLCPKCNRLTLTRQQIADMTGLRVETVIRTIRNLHDKGELTINKGKVYC